MNRFFVIAFAAVCLCYCTASCWAFGLPSADSLPYTVNRAQAIAVFRIESLDLKPKPIPKPTGPLGAFVGPDAFIALSTFEGEGTYTLTAVKNIKGDVGTDLTIHFPALARLGYASSFHPKAGDFIIAFLRREGDDWVAQDPWRPFVPLFDNANLTAITPGENALQQVESLILPKLEDEATRLLAADLLSNSANPKVFVALAPYADDPNLLVRDFVLSAFARHKQLSAIERIRDLNRLSISAQRGNPNGITLLAKFAGMKEALPLLNPLLFEPEQFIRINALDTLSRTQDASSLPFLLLTLYDPEYQKDNPREAYAMFAQITGAKLSVDGGDFLLHPDQARAQAWAWWQDELAGKHPTDEEEQPAVALRQLQQFQASDLAQLNLGLFMRSEITRRAAARGLAQFADASSIPYLLIALYDPQADIAYSAYASLHRVVPSLGAAFARARWDKDRAAQTKLAYDWWQQHLLDAEKPSALAAPIKAPVVAK